jgi:NADH:ubiquinone oxidoreductase subunit D
LFSFLSQEATNIFLRTLAINLTAEICGSRFGRGWIIPGGIRFDADVVWIKKAKKVLATIRERFRDAEALLFNSASALSRLEDTGTVTLEAARRIGRSRQRHPSRRAHLAHGRVRKALAS